MDNELTSRILIQYEQIAQCLESVKRDFEELEQLAAIKEVSGARFDFDTRLDLSQIAVSSAFLIDDLIKQRELVNGLFRNNLA